MILLCIIDRLREHTGAEDEPDDSSLFATVSDHVSEMSSLGLKHSLQASMSTFHSARARAMRHAP